MPLVQLTDIAFAYPGTEIFEGLTWQIDPGQRIGLVGPNGAGKSTLLRLLAGTLEPDEGQVARQKGIRVGYLRQSQEFGGGGDLLSALLSPFSHLLEIHAELQAIETRLAAGTATDGEMDRYGHLQDRYRQDGGYTLEARVKELAQDVGFHDADFTRPLATLSGGERGRLELATVLIQEPDLLLLDEPTNHLDVAAVEKLEDRLTDYPGAFVVVSHDRYFLDRTCREIVEVDGGDLEHYVGGWHKYVEERGARRERMAELVRRQKEEIARTEDFIRRNIAGQKTKQAKSRRKMLAKVERLEMEADAFAEAGRIGLRFEIGPHAGGKEMIKADGLEVGHAGASTLAGPFDVTIYRGDRVGVVGPNGCGKSTLVKTMIGRLPPRSGAVALGHEARIGYFDQKLGDLDDERSLTDEIRAVRGDLSPEALRTFLARFRFFGDDVFRKVKGLSGGERNRLSLAKMMLEPRNMLVLDEPTNHLDIPAREVLERALAAYEGTLLVVSHDRYFLDRVVTKLLLMEGGQVELFPGTYTDLREHRTHKPAPRAPQKPLPPPPPTENKQSWAASRVRDRERQKKEKRLAALEAEIGRIEEELQTIRAQLSTEHGGDWQKLHGLVEREQSLTHSLASRMGEWEKLGAELEGESATH
jgi:ATP-binding cassette subfamily F protein 3